MLSDSASLPSDVDFMRQMVFPKDVQTNSDPDEFIKITDQSSPLLKKTITTDQVSQLINQL